MTPRAASIVFVAALGVALVLRVAFVLALPFGQAVAHRLEGLNDEPAHFAYVRYLADHRAFPVQTHHAAEPGAFARADFEYYQPPLYYLVCAPMVGVAGERAGLLLCRAVSFVAGLLTLLVLWNLLPRLGLTDPARQIGVAFAALLPVHVYFTSIASNDGLCWLFALLLMRELVMRSAAETSGPADVRLGMLLGLGMLTKSALAVFYPVAFLVYLLEARRAPPRRTLIGGLIALGVSLLIAGPWYARNLSLYGSALALDVGFGPHEPGRLSLNAQAYAALGTLRSFWFPMQHVASQWPVRGLRGLELVLAACHGVALAWFLRRQRPLGAPLSVALAGLGMAFVSHIALGFSWGESEGRFLLTALAPIVYIIVAPVFAFAAERKWDERWAWAYLLLLAVHPYLFLAFA
jgi:4-amino-4-deoxy-L-arabinose transferase-like glycosyltransferase